MRLGLLAFIFLLILTLINAAMLRSNDIFAAAHDYAYVQLTRTSAIKYAWYAFAWREIIAFIATVIVFGFIASSLSRRRARKHAHPAFDDRIANRR